MAQIVFRDLPAVSVVERQLDLLARDLLLDDELEELPVLIDEASVQLFGITRQDTFYWALPEPVRASHDRARWEAQFDLLACTSRDPNAHWRAVDLDITCPEGRGLHCLDVFGRQLVCAVRGLHPRASLVFADRKLAA